MDLFYKDYGAGPPLLILHGLLGAGGNWHTLSSRVFGEHFHVYAIDQRNHGRSPHDPVHDYPSMAADLAGFMDRHGLDRAHVLGHSMGGKTAMQFALTHPERVDRLVVVDIAPKAYPPWQIDILDALRSLDLSAYRSRAEIDVALARRVPSLPIRQFLLKNLRPDGRGGYTWLPNLEALYRNYDKINAPIEAEAPFEGPTLFVRGAQSPYIEDGDLPAIRRLFPRAELVTIPGAGHWVHAEAPEAFAEAVLSFLRR
ncbi:MAG: alpha/beta fold hydrolase [Bacteroidetes bacterium]|nr:MAG: alpha/beta fold hydrolase [Bacteroidota bacterium]